MKPYQPIDCNFYDILEATATRKKTVEIIFKTIEKEERVQSRVINLYAKDSIEYMVMEKDRVIRLDQIISVDGHVLEGFGCKI